MFVSLIYRSLRIQTPPDRIGFFGFQSHPKRIGMVRGPNPFRFGHTNGSLGFSDLPIGILVLLDFQIPQNVF